MPMQRIPSDTKYFSRKLRHEMTDAELKLWRHLRLRQILGAKFRRQHPCGKYIVDFACIEAKLVIEVDGGQHGERNTQDGERTLWLESEGWKVVRFWNNEVLENTQAVLNVIHASLSK